MIFDIVIANVEWNLNLTKDEVAHRSKSYEAALMSTGGGRSVDSLVKFVHNMSSYPSYAVPSQAVLLDYGFYSVDSDLLKELYHDLLTLLFVDLSELHAACISGKLSEFIEESIGSREIPSRNWFISVKSVLKNMYPLMYPR